jgi:hypothetical protein
MLAKYTQESKESLFYLILSKKELFQIDFRGIK